MAVAHIPRQRDHTGKLCLHLYQATLDMTAFERRARRFVLAIVPDSAWHLLK
jgi:hypothetical protein